MPKNVMLWNVCKFLMLSVAVHGVPKNVLDFVCNPKLMSSKNANE